MLAVRDLHVRYGHAHVLQGVSLETADSPFALVGRNGMGKTTLCYAIAGLLRSSEGAIELDGSRIDGLSPNQVAHSGVALVPQGRRVFASLTVDEHFRLVGRRSGVSWTIDRAYHTFPRLAQRRANRGSELSGGEQQMLAIARALLMNPRLIVMDEPSEGLAPILVEHLVGVLRALSYDNVALFLVEQNLSVAASVAETLAVMVAGRIAAIVPTPQLLGDPELQKRYLGVSSTTKEPEPQPHQAE
jgi:branched-chain amino acid transport system ATP-binding protein